MAQLLLTLVGDDREGLVQALSSVVADHGGNWLESQMARLGGKFAGIALVEVDDARRDELQQAAEQLGELHVTVTDAGHDASPVGTQLTLYLVGNDHPGIVRQVTTELAARGVTIDEMHTATRPAPMADTTLFEATAQVRLPQGVSLDEVRDALEAIADELMVDLDLDETLDDDPEAVR